MRKAAEIEGKRFLEDVNNPEYDEFEYAPSKEAEEKFLRILDI